MVHRACCCVSVMVSTVSVAFRFRSDHSLWWLRPSLNQGREVRDMQRGPDHPEGKRMSRLCLDFSARAGLNVFPYDISLRSELRSQNISEKIYVLQPPPSSAHRVPLTEAAAPRGSAAGALVSRGRGSRQPEERLRP